MGVGVGVQVQMPAKGGNVLRCSHECHL